MADPSAIKQTGARLRNLLGHLYLVFSFGILYAGEGADYASWVVDLLTPMFLVQVAGLVILGIIGILLYPAGRPGAKHGRTIRLAALVLCAGLMSLIPGHYRDTTAEGNIFQNPALEYQRFINPNFDVELTGMYRFLVRDAQLRLEKASADHSREIGMTGSRSAATNFTEIGEPFCSFVISYTPHLPYTDEDPLAQTALARYPQYDVAQDREVAILRAKVRLTDDMFAGLLQRLEDDGLLEDTVIIGFGDHYAYGLSDRAGCSSFPGKRAAPFWSGLRPLSTAPDAILIWQWTR